MTVSPNRPNNDSRWQAGKPASTANAAELGSTDLPPTLFQLRDLTPTARGAEAKASSFAEQPASSAIETAQRNEFASAESPSFGFSADRYQDLGLGRPAPEALGDNAFAEHVRSEAGFGQNGNLDHMVSSEQDANQQTEVRSAGHRRDEGQPAGRSWMETVVAHRKGVVLLLIVVVAAVWTSRRGSSTPEDQFAASESVLDFDAGEIVVSDELGISAPSGEQVPLDSVSSTKMASGSSTSGLMTPSSQTPSAARPSDASVAHGAAPSYNLAGDSASAAHAHTDHGVPGENSRVRPEPTRPDQMDATVSLGSPAVSTIASNDAASSESVVEPSDESLTRSGFDSSNFAQSSSSDGSVIRPASSRMPNRPSIDAPSLEELEMAARAADSAPMQFDAAYEESATPAGVADWLQYLPPMPSVAPDAS
ncbi:hypothetical protein Pla22_06620 [Rubripirellula amarantea]|uniref:Uncharacterized protein n=1 Tax=Rubripirellula amarantea TaxID=2527999 RepID=A0A5C5WQ70_9BACT|nr:hypothetical protein [Rubripirellula amarantea]TWT53034.1 hypothetical protein Pla22_06620 [Rubripirellula amarantea]